MSFSRWLNFKEDHLLPSEDLNSKSVDPPFYLGQEKPRKKSKNPQIFYFFTFFVIYCPLFRVFNAQNLSLLSQILLHASFLHTKKDCCFYPTVLCFCIPLIPKQVPLKSPPKQQYSLFFIRFLLFTHAWIFRIQKI